MATVRLDNLIKPKIVNNRSISPAQEIRTNSTYTDLHLDLTLAKSIGVGLAPGISNDVLVDYDEQTIKNSLYNLFTTRPTQKVLDPIFGAGLENYLFEPINNVNGEIIADEMLRLIGIFEPRVSVDNIKVYLDFNNNRYEFEIYYTIPSLNKQFVYEYILQSNLPTE
jgi:phage baseplate assembly protein W